MPSMDIRSPEDLSARLISVADRIDASERPSKELVASELRQIVAAVEKNREKDKKGKKINRKDIDASTAASMHMGLLEKYKDFHDTGANLLGFRSTIVDGIPDDLGTDVVSARKECEKAFSELDGALRNARSAYSMLMAALARL